MFYVSTDEKSYIWSANIPRIAFMIQRLENICITTPEKSPLPPPDFIWPVMSMVEHHASLHSFRSEDLRAMITYAMVRPCILNKLFD